MADTNIVLPMASAQKATYRDFGKTQNVRFDGTITCHPERRYNRQGFN